MRRQELRPYTRRPGPPPPAQPLPAGFGPGQPRYKILFAADPERLEAQVCRALDSGYRPLGAPIVWSHADGGYVLLQAVWITEES